MAQRPFILTNPPNLSHQNAVYPRSTGQEGGGGGSSPGWEYTPTRLIDSFEDSDFSEYRGDTGGISQETATVKVGNGALRLHNPYVNENRLILSEPGDGLTNYPANGSVWRGWVRSPNGANVRPFFAYSPQPDGTVSFYRANLRLNNNNRLEIHKINIDNSSGQATGGGNRLAGVDVNTNQDTWYDLEIRWLNDGTITVTLRNTNFSKLAQVTATDTEFQGSSFGFDVNAGGEVTGLFDYWQMGPFPHSNELETQVWESASAWDNAANEVNVSHPSGTISPSSGVSGEHYGFENDGGSVPAGWSLVNLSSSNTNISTSRALGNRSWYLGGGNPHDGTAGTYSTGATTTGFPTSSPSQFTVSYFESGNANGIGFWPENGNGDPILGVGSSNPDPVVHDAGGETTLTSSGYSQWCTFTVTFDYGNNQATVDFEDSTGNTGSKTGGFVNNASQITNLSIGAFGTNMGSPSTDLDTYVDNIGAIAPTSLTKSYSFSQPTFPQLVGLDYTLNGGSLRFKLTGSPGSSPEHQTIVPSGGSNILLDWANAHQSIDLSVVFDSVDPTVAGMGVQG